MSNPKLKKIFETTDKDYIIFFNDSADEILPYKVKKRVTETGYITIAFKETLKEAKIAIRDDMWIRMLNKSGLWRITEDGELI